MKIKTLIKHLSKEEKEISYFLRGGCRGLVKKILTKELSNLQYRIKSLKAEQKYEDDKIKIEKTEKPERLLQFYFNARTTGMQAGGHGKGNANAAQAAYWKGVLEKRKIEIPPYAENQGTFNGPGSC